MSSGPKPYGPKYQELCEAVLIENECSTIAMACFYFLCRKIDWDTGITKNQMAHNTIGKHLNASYNTVARGMAQLRRVGVIDYHRRGSNWNGDANEYCFAIPTAISTPTQKQGRAIPKNRAAPYPKIGQLNPPPSLSEGKRSAPSRDAEGPSAFGELVRLHGYAGARAIEESLKEEALRAAGE